MVSDVHNWHTRQLGTVFSYSVSTYKIIKVINKEDKMSGTWKIWEDNIRMDLMERGWEGVDWIHLAQDRDQWWALVNTAMNVWVP
jgi:hypothetical protein